MKRILPFLFALLLLPFAVFAQNKTSSSIQGVVKDAQGRPLAGANVVAIHKPSGTRYGTATRTNGHFTFKNVRTGGPYAVQVTFIGFNAQKKTITNIELGNTATINFTLQKGNQKLGQITVSATVNPVFSKSRTGAKAHLSQQSIDRTPQLSRSLSSYTSLTPYNTSGSSFAGTNNRYNNIKVDGSTLNDVFGLSGNGLPGGQAGVSSPVSIDAIKEINVDVAPFGVTNNNFNGAQINAITKSGTNEYHGDVYFQMQNQSMEGRYQLDSGGKSNPSEDFHRRFYGLSIGGPIVKNKLFFFVNAELKREATPVGGGLAGSGAGNAFDVGADTLQMIQNILNSQYGYNPGSFKNSPSLGNNNSKVLAKLNWNISDKNKFMLRYNHVDSKVGDGISRGKFDYDFSNRKYFRKSKQNSFIAELNSSFSNNASNTFRIGYTRIRFGRDVAGQPFPEVDVNLYNIHGHRKSYDIFAGIDRFSQANQLGQDLYQLTDNFTYIIGNNELTFGTSNHLYHFSNLYVQDKWGYYVFDGLDELKAGNPYEYHLSYLYPEGKPMADFSALQTGFYIQDEWTPTDRLTITPGLRIDIPFFLSKPTFNRKAQQAFEYNTSDLKGGQILWSPRLGFNWRATSGEYATQLRGGIGIFSGPPPFVWISNQYSNTGVDYARLYATDGYYTVNGEDKYIDIGGKGFFSPHPNKQPHNPYPQGSGLNRSQTTEVDLMSHNFKYPQSLKFDLAVDQQLPWGITATIEGIYTDDINNILYKNINLKKLGETPYGRPLYGTVFYDSKHHDADGTPAYIHTQNFNNVILLTNTHKGYRYSLSAELKKQFATGLSFDVSYTFNRARTVINGTSSRAISNWQYNPNKDVNNPRLGTSAFERRNHIMARASYAFVYGRGSSTVISLVYQGYSGIPLSWLYNGNANVDTRFDNDLVYVPKRNLSDVVLASKNPDALNAFINNHPALKDHRGKVIRRGAGVKAPFQNFLDLRLNQKIATVGGQSLELSVSIFNLPNLLNYKWGAHRSVSFGEVSAWTLQQYVDNDYIKNNPNNISDLSSTDLGKPVIDFDPDNVTRDRLYSIDNVSSRWRLQFGIKYNF